MRDTYEKMKKGNSSLGNVSSKDGNNDRSRKNNGQTRPGLDKKKIAEKQCKTMKIRKRSKKNIQIKD